MKILTGGRLIDGTGAAPVDGATIVLRDNRIAAVTTRNQSDWPEDAEIIDVSGKPQSTRHLRTAAVLKQTLAAGYTMIRDAAGLDVGFKRAIEEGLIDGPRLVLSLSIVSPIGGIGDAVSPSGLPLDDCCCIPGDPLVPNSVANSLADVRPVVRRMVRAGADVIKCATTGGASSRAGHGPRDSAFNLDEMQALVDEAHALDRRVMCHALGGRASTSRSRPASIRSSTAAISTRTRAISNAWPSAASFSCRRCWCTNTTANRRNRMSANAPRYCGSITSRASSGRSRWGSRSWPAPMPAGTVTRPMPASSNAWSNPA
jgi:hypothetical protein